MAPLRLSILCDNTSHARGFGHEWGFSVAVSLPSGTTWLWDAGATGLFLENARKMGVDPADFTAAAFSHGHYDHTGGLAALLEVRPGLPLFAHPDFGRPRYAVHQGRVRDIGLPHRLLTANPVRGSARLAEGLTMVTDIPRLPGLPQAVKDLSLDPDGLEPDPVDDDAFLLLDSDAGPVVLLGCCHAGLANALAEAVRLAARPLRAVVGGLHLFNVDDEEWEKAARALEASGAQVLAAGHCTGAEAFAYLAGRLDIRVLPLGSGLALEF